MDVLFFETVTGRRFICIDWFRIFFKEPRCFIPYNIRLKLSNYERKGAKRLELKMLDNSLYVDNTLTSVCVILGKCFKRFAGDKVRKNRVYYLSWEEVK